ncbi:MAG: hypothetical protein KF901_15040 [Myxococcales bacterium]|nr:hypothetical protein [Myxococcales bacterium]
MTINFPASASPAAFKRGSLAPQAIQASVSKGALGETREASIAKQIAESRSATSCSPRRSAAMASSARHVTVGAPGGGPAVPDSRG